MKGERGVSLIEALVAVAVMGFGMLGVVGMQATLRYNSDVAKQRSEAVRMAQETIENRRAYSTLAPTPGADAFADIVARSAGTVLGITSNTSFLLAESVVDSSDGTTKTLIIDVSWTDRTDRVQAVRLSTSVTKVLPELGASLVVPAFGTPTRLPFGRHFAIPRGAVDQGDGTSTFSPPGGATVSWTFSNTSGYIVSTCIGGVCTDVDARLLAGYVRFATGVTEPTPSMAENPPSLSIPLVVEVSVTFPSSFVVSCFQQDFTAYVAYFCAVRVDGNPSKTWSGQSNLVFAPLATTVSDTSATAYRVCRYTPVRDSHPVVPAIKNEEHPLNYASVSTPLINQNFLVTKAGDSVTAFTCPADDSATPFVNGNTWHHQPSI